MEHASGDELSEKGGESCAVSGADPLQLSKKPPSMTFQPTSLVHASVGAPC